MRIEIADKMKTWNLKIFLSVSLGIHILLFSMLTLLFPDFKIDQITPLHVEVSLLPLISEAKPLPKVVSSPVVKDQIRKEEAEAPQKTKDEESVAKQEQELKISTFSISPNPIPFEEPTLLLPENRKGKIGNEIEEKVVKKLLTQAVVVRQSSESTPNDKTEDLKNNNRGSAPNGNKEEPFYQKEMKPEPSVSAQTGPSLPIVSNPQPISTIPPPNQEVISLLSGGDDITPPLPSIASSEAKKDFAKLPSISSNREDVFIQPKYVENPKPTYPQEARKKGYEGEVLLRVEVLANGRVGRMEVKKSSGYEILDRSALTTVKEWKFIPANQGNGAIPCWVNIPIKFQLQ